LTIDFRQYYDLEAYLFETVRSKFHQEGFLTAFDFFCIVIWKANRAKTLIARKLLSRGYASMDESVKELTSKLFHQQGEKERLRYLFEDWGFYLPMASAILTVLYPDQFTIYDYRVCNTLGKFHNLGNISKFENLWNGYQEFKRAVEITSPKDFDLRDKDRFLVGKSFYEDLLNDIRRDFKKQN
jgi:hypothetical protein